MLNRFLLLLLLSYSILNIVCSRFCEYCQQYMTHENPTTTTTATTSMNRNELKCHKNRQQSEKWKKHIRLVGLFWLHNYYYDAINSSNCERLLTVKKSLFSFIFGQWMHYVSFSRFDEIAVEKGTNVKIRKCHTGHALSLLIVFFKCRLS